MLAGFAAAANFALPALLLLTVPVLACWGALKLRIDGAVIERWLLDMLCFSVRGRILAAGAAPQRGGPQRCQIQAEYRIDCPAQALGHGQRISRGFRFEIGA